MSEQCTCVTCRCWLDTGLRQFEIDKGNVSQWEGLCKLNPVAVPKDKNDWCGQHRPKE